MSVLLLLAMVVLSSAPSAFVRAESASMDAWRKRLEEMTAAQKEVLRLKKEQFDQLPKETKQSLRTLRDAINLDPNAKKLHEVMFRYNDWLKSLPASTVAQLSRMDRGKRIVEIKRIIKEQEEAQFNELAKRSLQPRDYQVIVRWVENQIMGRLPANLRSEIARLDPRRRRFEMMRLYRQHAANSDLFKSNPVTPEEIDQLINELSPEARDIFQKVDDFDARYRIVRDWIGAGLLSSFRPQVSKKELDSFLREKVSPQQREFLENLPRERMMQELQKLYNMSHYRRAFGDSRRSFPKPRPGDFPNSERVP